MSKVVGKSLNKEFHFERATFLKLILKEVYFTSDGLGSQYRQISHKSKLLSLGRLKDFPEKQALVLSEVCQFKSGTAKNLAW
jgi:hypothetical protein